MVKKILFAFTAVISAILVLISLIVVTPLYAILFLIGGKNSHKIAHKISNLWAKYVLLSCFTLIKVSGKENLDPNETYIFVGNHSSFLDIPSAAASTNNFFKFLAKDELKKIPLLGFIIKNLYILVRRNSLRDRVESVRKMEKALADGVSVFIYPEGTRNQTPEPLSKFQDGAFHLAVSTQKPIVVLTLIGTAKVLPPGSLFNVQPGVIKAFWSRPIYTKGMTKDDIPKLREMVMDIMKENLLR